MQDQAPQPAPRHARPEPVPRVPSEDGGVLATVLRTVQWHLDDLAHDLPAGRAEPQRCVELATMLEQLAIHLCTQYVVPGMVEYESNQHLASRLAALPLAERAEVAEVIGLMAKDFAEKAKRLRRSLYDQGYLPVDHQV